MSIQLVFSVYDSKAEAFTQPFFSATLGVAVRSFTAAVSDERHDFHRFSEDFTLFEIGIWDQETGTFEPREAKKSVVTAAAVMAQLKRENGDAR